MKTKSELKEAKTYYEVYYIKDTEEIVVTRFLKFSNAKAFKGDWNKTGKPSVKIAEVPFSDAGY